MNYLICKEGLYYRPDAAGYTGCREDAGRFTLEVAQAAKNLFQGVIFFHENDAPRFAKGLYNDKRIKVLKHENRAMREALTEIQKTAATIKSLFDRGESADSLLYGLMYPHESTKLIGLDAVIAAQKAWSKSERVAA